ncbi:ferredoxin [Mycobacterium sp. 852014-52144_SCH5372336]|uniref:ferredoxin n=1 Tax=Mycobacterium sp. 852014-52144_SCH5372336 TaxID=1834115 RepID=UPI0009EEF80B|nr:(4Fe-4S)-binding protein [Mycobacterium sp. 852014-52144_SCH5372336]
MRIRADREICVGAGMCVMADDTVFDQGDDGLVLLVKEEVCGADEKRARVAVRHCPSGALRILDE